jgi:hypothetical protein
LTTIGDRSHIT